MKFLCAILLGFTLSAATAAAPQNFWVELRWVDSALSAASLDGVMRGAVVVGTAGSVSPRPGQSLRTATRPEDSPAAIQRVLVLNGQSASIKLTEHTTRQMLDFALDIGLPQAGAAAAAGRVIAAPRTTSVDVSRGFVVRPSWPGGRQPVRVELQAFAPQADGQQSVVSSTVALPLGDWLTVARSGATARAPEPGSLSSRDAVGQPGRELQLRVGLAP